MPFCRSALLAVLAVIGLGTAPVAQSQDAGTQGIALVIGNETYASLPNVPGATADAASVGVYLRQLGLEVQQHVNLTQGELLAASQRFIKRLAPGQVAVVYFSGHVLQLNGANFLIPTNARLDRATSLLSSGMPLNTLIGRIEGMELTEALFFLEAGLRVDPTGDGALANGMAEPPVPSIPSVFALSVEPGQTITVADPTLGDFTARILQEATKPGVSLQQAMETARDELATRRGNAPPPWVRETLDAPLVMMPAAVPPGVDTSEQRVWDAVVEQPDDRRRLTALTIYLQLYPDGMYAAEAADMLSALEAAVLTGDGDAGQSGDAGTDAGADIPDEVASAEDGDDPDRPDDRDSTDAGTDDTGEAGDDGATSGDGQTADADGTADEGRDGPAEINRPPRFAAPEPIALVAGAEPVATDLPDPTDPDDDALSVTVVSIPDGVTVSSGGESLDVGDVLTPAQLNELSFSAGTEAVGERTLVLSISDAGGASIEARIALRVDPPAENRPPVVVDLPALEVSSDAGPVELSIPTPTDPDGDVLALVVTELPRFGVVRAGDNPIALREPIPIEELGSLNYFPSRTQSGDAGRFWLEVSDAHGNSVQFGMAIRVTPAPTPEGAMPWDPSAVDRDDARMAQQALQALGFYDGTLDGIFGRGSQAALAAYQESIGVEPTGTMTLRQRAELAAAGARAAADAARAVAAQAEEVAARAHEIAASEGADEISFSVGVYRGEVSGGAANGYGVIQSTGGVSIAGQFENNVGKLGVFVFGPGDRYVGEAEGNAPEGLGVRYLEEGWIFAGQWTGGQATGLGVSETTLGTTVAGEWVANQLSGYGAVEDEQTGRRVGVMESSTFTALY